LVDLVESGVVGRFGLGRRNVVDRLKQSTVVLHSGNSVTDSTPGNSAGVALNLNGDALLRTASYKVDTKIAARHGPANSITPIGEKLLDILLKLRTAHRVDIHDLECPELPVFDYKMNRDCGDYDPESRRCGREKDRRLLGGRRPLGLFADSAISDGVVFVNGVNCIIPANLHWFLRLGWWRR